MPKPSHQEPKISRLPPPAGPEKVVVLNPDEYKQDQTMLTVILHEEDHTVGNALKHVICQMKGVEFCGYNVPHPLEDKILIRIQTEKGVSAGDILLQGLVDLSTIFDEIQKKFTTVHSDFIQGKEERRVEGTSHEADSFEVE